MRILLLLILILFTELIYAQQPHSEKQYVNYIQSLIGGKREVSVYGGRVDLVTADYAFEIEWAKNWKESIGQSLWYALQTNKKPGIIIILESQEEYNYFLQLNSALQYAGLEEKIQIFLFPNDFQELIDEQKG